MVATSFETGSTWNTLGINQIRIAATAPTSKERRNAWSVALYYWKQGADVEPNHLPCLLNRLHSLWVLGVSFTVMEEAVKLLNQLELDPEKWRDIPPPNTEGYELAWRIDSPYFQLEDDFGLALPSVDQYLYYLARWIAERIALYYQPQAMPFWRIAAAIYPKDLQAQAVVGLGLSKSLQVEGIHYLRQNQAQATTKVIRKWTEACFQVSVSFFRRKTDNPKLSIQKNSIEVIDVPYENHIMSLEGSLDSVVTHCHLAQGRWFEAEIDFVKSYLKPGMTFIDVGANVGSYTLVAAQAVGSEGKVVAFEPTQACVEILKHNANMNQLPQVTVIPCALDSESGKAYFLESDDSACNRVVKSLVGITHPVKTVQKVTLDEWWRSMECPSVDMIKVDVFTDSFDVIRGGRELIKSCSPIIQVEAKGDLGSASREVSSYLSELGYTFFAYNPALNELSMARKQARNLSTVNLVAVPEARYVNLKREGILEKGSFPSKELDPSLSSLLWDLVEEKQ
jgi:FkbM family methyltransferase